MNKHVEVEARWINLDEKEVEAKLKKIGATKTGNFFYKEWLFIHEHWTKDHRRVRVRTDGTTTWLTYKANKTWKVDSTEEVQLTVSSAEDAVKLLEKADLPLVRYQEKKRVRYTFNDITFDVDFWPKIPMVLEIEADSEEKIKEGAAMLGLKWDDALFEDQKVVHEKFFDVDLDAVDHYAFKEKE